MGGYAQQIVAKSRCVKLKKSKDTRILSFENESIVLEFSAKEVAEYITKDLKKPKWQIREYDGKKQLLDSLREEANSIRVRTSAVFSTEKIRGMLQSAMLVISWEFLKIGHVSVKKDGQSYTEIFYKYINGPYGNKSAIFSLDGKPFLEFIIALGE